MIFFTYLYWVITFHVHGMLWQVQINMIAHLIGAGLKWAYWWFIHSFVILIIPDRGISYFMIRSICCKVMFACFWDTPYRLILLGWRFCNFFVHFFYWLTASFGRSCLCCLTFFPTLLYSLLFNTLILPPRMHEMILATNCHILRVYFRHSNF